MSAVAEKLSFSEFQVRFGGQETSYEYWNGDAIPKAMRTWIHGALQIILGRLLFQFGYICGSEVELRIATDYRPKPDIIATRGRLEEPYPTKGVELIIEILSPEDSMSYILDKCAQYQRWDFEGIFVLDTNARVVYQWVDHGLKQTNHLAELPSVDIWNALDNRPA